MNIQAINFLSKRCQNPSNNIVVDSNYYNLNNASYPNLKPLQKDTVSFCGKLDPVKKAAEKVVREGKKTEHIRKGLYKLASEVNEEAQKPAKEFFAILKRGLKNLVESDTHLDAPIMAGTNGIKCRVKSKNSIVDKMSSKGNINCKKDIYKMGDLIGTRIVMRNTTPKDFDALFKELTKMVKNGDLKVREIRNYRPTPKESYVPTKILDKFEEECCKIGLRPIRKETPIENAYTAIHMIVELPNGMNAEIQIMGRDMEFVKDIEDFYYKRVTCGKDLAPKYKEIQDLIDEKLKGLSDFQHKTLDMYIRDSYINARAKAPRKSRQKMNPEREFLPFPYSLPQELSYVNLYKMKEKCDSAAKVTEAIPKTEITQALILRPKQ